MMRKYLSRAAVLVFCAGLPLLMAPSGGFPSRPKFRDVTISGAVDGTVAASIQNGSNGAASVARLSMTSGDVNASMYAAGSGRTSAIVTNGPSGGQSVWRTIGGQPLVLGTDNKARLIVAGDAPTAQIRGTGTGSANSAYMQFADSGGTVVGFVGDGSGSNSNVHLVALTSGASVNLQSGAGGSVTANGSAVLTNATSFAIAVLGSASPSFQARSAGAASWSVSQPSNGVIRVTHNLGLASGGDLVCTVSAVAGTFAAPVSVWVSARAVNSFDVSGSQSGAATSASFVANCMRTD